MQPYIGLVGVAICFAVGWWNHRVGGYNGARPNWWKLVVCGIFTMGGLFGLGSALLNFSANTIAPLGFFSVYALFSGYFLVGEAAWFRKSSPSDAPRMANPWKMFVCVTALGSGVNGVLRPMRGPLVPSNTDQAQGAVAMSAMLAVLGLVGVASELRRLYIHAKSLK